mgnify:CR=1 FL=1
MSWNDRIWWLQLCVSLAWAAAMVSMWLAWTGATLRDLGPADNGLAVVMTTSCCGLSWIVGLVPILLVFSILRR